MKVAAYLSWSGFFRIK